MPCLYAWIIVIVAGYPMFVGSIVVILKPDDYGCGGWYVPGTLIQIFW